MKNLALIFISIFFGVVSVFAQQTIPTPTPKPTNQAVLDTPKKPSKPPKTAEEFYEAARWESWNTRNYEAAIKLLDEAIKLKTDYSDAYFLRGNLKSSMKNCTAAIADYNKVIELDESIINTYQYRAECKIALKDLQGALEDYDKSVANLAANGKIQYNAFEGRGKLKYLLKDYDGAVKDFSSAARMNVNTAAYFYRALTFLKMSDANRAIADFRGLANYYFEVTKESRQKYPEFYTEKTDYPFNENPLATLEKKKPVKKNGVGTGAGVTLSLSKAACEGCPDDKFAEFEDKIKPDGWFYSEDKIYLSPSYVGDDAEVVFYYLGDLLEQKGEIADALDAFTNAIIAKGYSDEIIRFRRGRLFLRTKALEPAVRDFSWVISQNRNSAEAYLERGIAIQMLGHKELAQKDFDQYLKLTQSPDAKDNINKRIEEVKKAQDKPLKKEEKILSQTRPNNFR